MKDLTHKYKRIDIYQPTNLAEIQESEMKEFYGTY